MKQRIATGNVFNLALQYNKRVGPDVDSVAEQKGHGDGPKFARNRDIGVSSERGIEQHRSKDKTFWLPQLAPLLGQVRKFQ